MKRFLKGFAACCVAVALLLSQGCREEAQTLSVDPNRGGKEVQQPKTKISFWTYCTNPQRDQDYQRFGQMLAEKYPDIELDYLGIAGDIPTYIEKLDVAIAANTAPDFIDYYDSKYIQNGFYEPLDSYFDTWDQKDEISPLLIQQMRSHDPKGGKLYAIPISSQPWVMWIRKDLLQAAGLPVPQTWDDFFYAVAKLTDKSKGRYGIAIRGGPGSSNSLELLMYSYSGLTSYFDSNGKSTINHPKNVEFAERYLGLYNQYSAQDDLAKGWTQLTAAFQAGKAAIIFHNLGSGESMDIAFHKNDAVFQAAMIPRSDIAAPNNQFILPRSVGMNSHSKNKEAVFRAITVFCSPKVQIPRCQTQGEVPARVDTETLHEYFQTARPYLKLGMKIMVDTDSAQLIQPPLYLSRYTKIQSEIEPMIQKVMVGQMTAKEMLDQWALLLEQAQREAGTFR